MIRSADLRPGDVLIDWTGERWQLAGRACGGWVAVDVAGRCDDAVIPDSEVDRRTRRSWWLDEAAPR